MFEKGKVNGLTCFVLASVIIAKAAAFTVIILKACRQRSASAKQDMVRDSNPTTTSCKRNVPPLACICIAGGRAEKLTA